MQCRGADVALAVFGNRVSNGAVHSVGVNLCDDRVLPLMHIFAPDGDTYLRSHHSNTRTKSIAEAKEHQFPLSWRTWCEISDCPMLRDLFHRPNEQLAARRNFVPGRYATRVRQRDHIEVHGPAVTDK